jgi:peptide/nickel transport system permease protein
MTDRRHLPPIEDPLVPERSLADEIAPQIGDHEPIPVPDEPEDARISTVSTESQSYLSLVWRRFSKSFPGMLGFVMVAILLTVALFADFFAPVHPNAPGVAFAPPDKISWYVPGEGWRLMPVAFQIAESAELDPVTFQPIVGPDLENPRPIRLFVPGWDYKLFGLIPMNRHFIGLADGTQLHVLGTDKLGRDIFSRGIVRTSGPGLGAEASC